MSSRIREMEKRNSQFERISSKNARDVVDYYTHIDSGDIESALQIFTHFVTYNRCEQNIEGIDALKVFYNRDRQIDGHHELEYVFPHRRYVGLLGTFHKLTNSGVEPIHFWDVFEFWKGLFDVGVHRRDTMLYAGTLDEVSENPVLWDQFGNAIEDALESLEIYGCQQRDGEDFVVDFMRSGTGFIDEGYSYKDTRAGIFGTGDGETRVYLPVGIEKIK